VIPVSKSPKVIRQTTSQISRKPARMGTVLIKTSAKAESSPVMVKKHKSASECFCARYLMTNPALVLLFCKIIVR
jgi:hypothetical protein